MRLKYHKVGYPRRSSCKRATILRQKCMKPWHPRPVASSCSSMQPPPTPRPCMETVKTLPDRLVPAAALVGCRIRPHTRCALDDDFCCFHQLIDYASNDDAVHPINAIPSAPTRSPIISPHCPTIRLPRMLHPAVHLTALLNLHTYKNLPSCVPSSGHVPCTNTQPS